MEVLTVLYICTGAAAVCAHAHARVSCQRRRAGTGRWGGEGRGGRDTTPLNMGSEAKVFNV